MCIRCILTRAVADLLPLISEKFTRFFDLTTIVRLLVIAGQWVRIQ
jgi:hypothetical protein